MAQPYMHSVQYEGNNTHIDRPSGEKNRVTYALHGAKGTITT